MKNLFFYKNVLMKSFISLLLIIIGYVSPAQHIQYRDKKKPVAKTDGTNPQPVPVPNKIVVVNRADTSSKPNVVIKKTEVVIPVDTIFKPVVIVTDTSQFLKKSKAAFTMNPRIKKPYVEEQNMCNLLSRPELAPQLPIVINKVSPEMVKKLKERYEGRLYSITGLNMIDERLKFKLKICDKDNGKFRSEYLDKDGKVVNDPDLDYQ